MGVLPTLPSIQRSGSPGAPPLSLPNPNHQSLYPVSPSPQLFGSAVPLFVYTDTAIAGMDAKDGNVGSDKINQVILDSKARSSSSGARSSTSPAGSSLSAVVYPSHPKDVLAAPSSFCTMPLPLFPPITAVLSPPPPPLHPAYSPPPSTHAHLGTHPTPNGGYRSLAVRGMQIFVIYIYI